MGNFAAYLLRTEHLLLMLAVSVTVSMAPRLVPALADNPYWVRLLPVLPIAACSAAVWLPGLVSGTVAERVLLGVVLGALCGHAYKMVTQTIFGNDRRISDHPRPRL